MGRVAHNAYLGSYSEVYDSIQANDRHKSFFQAHHIGQDAALRGVTGYSYYQAPAIELYSGPTN